MSFERILTNPGGARLAEQTFTRRELSLILNVYGRMVAAGEWRDYAIDHRRERAVFSIFRGSAELPSSRGHASPFVELDVVEGLHGPACPTGREQRFESPA